MTNEKIILITGANSGIGLGMTKALLEKDYHVATVDLNDYNLRPLLELFCEKLIVLTADLTVTSQVNDAATAVIEKWGKIDILVNNACRAFFLPFEEKDPEDTWREFDVNYFGCTRMIRAVLPHMKRQGGGIIHNVGSAVGLTGFSGMCGYVSTKGAIEALTLTLRIELKPFGIHVGSMHPPLTKTPSAMPSGIPPEVMKDADKVGLRLAERILCTKHVVTPDYQTALFLKFCRWFPHTAGKLMSAMAYKAKTGKKTHPPDKLEKENS